LKDTAIPFHFNDIAELKEKAKGIEAEIAAIIVEPARGEDAPPEYLKSLKEFASEIGAVLIFDEITSGFRMCAGGIHLNYNVSPDIAVFAKSMANGYAMAAIIGTETVMSAAQSSFISSTNWTERIGPVAALATIRKYVQRKVDKHIINIGNQVKQIWIDKARKHDLPIYVSGLPSLCHLAFEDEVQQEFATYFTVRMLELGFLGYRQFKPSYAHTANEVDAYSGAVDTVFSELSRATPGKLLETPTAHTGFTRLTKE